MFQALKLVDHTHADMSKECLDELRATITFARWNGFDVAADAKAVLAANTTRPEDDWRLSALEDQCEGARACALGLQVDVPVTTGEKPGADTLDDSEDLRMWKDRLRDEIEELKVILGTSSKSGVKKIR